MKIEKVVFNNFRNYKGNQVFELSSKINILFGDNGNGKSSFFDGLEWCLTGKISRFGDRDTLKGVLANKNIQIGQECYVELHFKNFLLKRSFKLNKGGFGNSIFSIFSISESSVCKKIDSGELNVDRELRRIIKDAGYEYRDKRFKVGEVINKAYILSQDQVTEFVTNENPTEKYEALSSIMGFENVIKFRRNLMNMLKIFDGMNESINNIVSELRNKKVEYRNFSKEINSEVVKNYQNVFGNISENEEKLKLQYNEQQKNIEQINDLISKSQYYISKFNLNTLDEVLEKQKKTSKNTEELETVINDKVIKINKYKEEKEKLKEILLEIEKNQESKETYEKSVKKINSLQNQIMELGFKLEEADKLEQKHTLLSIEKEKLSFCKEFTSEFLQSKKFIDEFESQKKHINELITKDSATLMQLEEQHKKLNDSLLLKSSEKNIQSLIHNVEGILDYVQANEIKNSCPVCSNETSEDLDTIIKRNIEQMMLETVEIKKSITEQLNLKDQITEKINQLTNSLNQRKLDIKDLDSKFTLSVSTIQRVQNHYLYSDYFAWNDEEIYNQINNVDFEIERTEKAISLINKISKYQNKMKSVNLNSKFSNYNHTNLKIEIEKLQTQLNTFEEEVIKLRASQDETKIFYYGLSSLKEFYIEQFVIYNVDSVESLLKILESKRNRFSENLELVENVIPLIESIKFNKDIDVQITKIDEEIKKHRNDIKNIEEKIKKVKQVLLSLNTEFGEEALNFLNSDKSEIQMFYRYLNPVPSKFNQLKFEVIDDERLYIKVSDLSYSKNQKNEFIEDASMILSSGQLNVLALAIFIATNKAQRSTDFDFIAIDDPIQNMDDVNRFSICDVLSNLDRQLIFSTHDQDFLNLFIKKNEYQTQDLSLFILDAEKNEYKSLVLK